MKLAKTFTISFLIAGLTVIALDLNFFSFSEKIAEYVASFANKKMSADHYPLAVFTLLLVSAATELALLFKFNVSWLEKAKENRQRLLVKIGGSLLGSLAALTGLAYAKGSIDEAKLGISLTLMVALYVAAPLFMASVLYMLRDPDSNASRMKLIKWVAGLTYSSIGFISIWGIFRVIWPNF